MASWHSNLGEGANALVGANVVAFGQDVSAAAVARSDPLDAARPSAVRRDGATARVAVQVEGPGSSIPISGVH